MGDERHKRPPPDEIEEDVTPEFRREANEALKLNALNNRLRHLKKGAPNYQISNRAELADAVDTDKTMINKIIGPAKPTTKVKLVARSVFVGRIRDALQLAAVAKLSVRTDRAAVLRWIADLSDEAFKVFDDEYKRQMRKTEK